MVASHHREEPLRVGPGPFFYVLDPGSVDPEWDVVLCFAGNGARVTADTARLVDDESVFQMRSLPRSLAVLGTKY